MQKKALQVSFMRSTVYVIVGVTQRLSLKVLGKKEEPFKLKGCITWRTTDCKLWPNCAFARQAGPRMAVVHSYHVPLSTAANLNLRVAA